MAVNKKHQREPCQAILRGVVIFAAVVVVLQLGSLALYGFASYLSPYYLAIMVWTLHGFLLTWRLSGFWPTRALTWGAWIGLACVGAQALLYAVACGEPARMLGLLPVGVILHSFYVHRRRPAVVYAVAVGLVSAAFAFLCPPPDVKAIADAVSRTVVSAFGVAISATKRG